MPQSPTIRVAPVTALNREAVLGLRVHPAQRDYVGLIDDLLADADRGRDSEPMAILHGELPIGYYRLDAHPRSVAGRDFDVPACGLRAFFIDADWQGRGLGARALASVFADLASRHPSARLLVLTVNQSNRTALALYRRAGFSDSGELYHGGRSGPQHLLLRALPVCA